MKDIPRDKTAREKAIEFAKNVPKPKVKVYNQDNPSESPTRNPDLVNIQEEDYD